MSRAAALAALALAVAVSSAAAAPMRPLPTASARAPATGVIKQVDPQRGDDAGDGIRTPWRTLAHAVTRLAPGDTLYLRGGVYYEAVEVTAAGTATAPITIRAAPGELAILDGGLRELAESPATAWEPVGRAGEYRSTKTYPQLGNAASEQDRGVWLTGQFASDAVPLHGYRLVEDLRSTNEYWNLPDNLAAAASIYVGPGIWLDRTSKRIHARLAHTRLVGGPAYRGETDPRKVALVIGADRMPLRVIGARHVRFQDLVVRGSATHAVHIERGEAIELDGVTIHGGSPALWVASTRGLRVIRSAVRGSAAPWSSRASMKYRGNSPYLVIAASGLPQSRDWELAYNDFTDGHDGLVLDSIAGLRFHHNRVENFNDDALYLTLPPRAALPRDTHIHDNVFARVLTALSFAEDRAPGNPIGPGAYVFRNVFDLRDGSYSWPPKDAAADTPVLALAASKTVGDHGSPTWEPLFVYHNTVITAGPVHRGYYGALFVQGTKASVRRVFNNLFVQLAGPPGLVFPFPNDDLRADANLHWSVADGARLAADALAPLQRGPAAQKGWAQRDRFADPRFARTPAARGPLDLRLGAGSPAIDAGIALPAAWPDSRRAQDRGAPDLGALPAGAAMLEVGPAARP